MMEKLELDLPSCFVNIGGVTNITIIENDFLEALGKISYKRHTVFENGVNQVCLTKIAYE